jgi:hypothetical protein
LGCNATPGAQPTLQAPPRNTRHPPLHGGQVPADLGHRVVPVSLHLRREEQACAFQIPGASISVPGTGWDQARCGASVQSAMPAKAVHHPRLARRPRPPVTPAEVRVRGCGTHHDLRVLALHRVGREGGRCEGRARGGRRRHSGPNELIWRAGGWRRAFRRCRGLQHHSSTLEQLTRARQQGNDSHASQHVEQQRRREVAGWGDDEVLTARPGCPGVMGCSSCR